MKTNSIIIISLLAIIWWVLMFFSIYTVLHVPYYWIGMLIVNGLLCYFAFGRNLLLGVIVMIVTLGMIALTVSNFMEGYCESKGLYPPNNKIITVNKSDVSENQWKTYQIYHDNPGNTLQLGSEWKNHLDCHTSFSYTDAFKDIFTNNWL